MSLPDQAAPVYYAVNLGTGRQSWVVATPDGAGGWTPELVGFANEAHARQSADTLNGLRQDGTPGDRGAL